MEGLGGQGGVWSRHGGRPASGAAARPPQAHGRAAPVLSPVLSLSRGGGNRKGEPAAVSRGQGLGGTVKPRGCLAALEHGLSCTCAESLQP